MQETVVLGTGLHPFGRWPKKSAVELAEVAIAAALKDANVPFRDVQAAYLGAEFAGFFDGRMVVQNFGWTGIPVTQIQQACASSSTARSISPLAVASAASRPIVSRNAGIALVTGGVRGGVSVPVPRSIVVASSRVRLGSWSRTGASGAAWYSWYTRAAGCGWLTDVSERIRTLNPASPLAFPPPWPRMHPLSTPRATGSIPGASTH